MKTMINPRTNQQIEVIAHVILSNYWEYYICKAETNDVENHVYLCLVLGDYDEIGDVCLKEIEPYVISQTKQLDGVMPAPNWQWAN